MTLRIAARVMRIMWASTTSVSAVAGSAIAFMRSPNGMPS